VGRYLLMGGALALTFSNASVAAQAVSGASTQLASVADSDAKMVCKSVARSGSRLTDRKCHTQGEWDAISESARRSAHEAFDRTGFHDCHSMGSLATGAVGPAANGSGGC
jgi:hypothetical protein